MINDKINEMIEYLDIVSDKDDVIGSLPYDKAYETKGTIRIAHIYLFDKRGSLILQQRSFHKPLNGGTWMMSAGGHVRAGESYEEAAHRELIEELGFDTKLKFVGKELFSFDANHKKYFAVFEGEYKGEKVVLDPVESIGWNLVSLQSLKEMIDKGEPMHPELVHELKLYYGF